MSTRSAIESVAANVEESIGIRVVESHPNLSPAPKAKDSGRRPSRFFGKVSVDKVIPDSQQPRKSFDEEALNELAASVTSKGQLQPIRVRWSEHEGKWAIISGERRWRAATLAGLDEVTCYFHEGQLTESEILEEQIIENLHRSSLKPVEEAMTFSRLMQLNKWTGKQVANAIGIHPAKVSRALSLLKLPDDIKQQVDEGAISSRTAYEISKIDDDNQRRELVSKARRGMSNERTARIVRQRKGKKKRARPNRGVHLNFTTQDGWLISVTRAQMGNYHEVEQALTETLEEVRHRINNNVQLF